jgi:anti-sigma factor RsiW
MTEIEHRASETDLQAYLDGELDGAERARVESALAADPRLRERLERDRRALDRLREAGAAVAEEPIPERLLATINRSARTVARRRFEGAKAAAVVVCAFAAGWLGAEWRDIDHPAPSSSTWEGLALFPAASVDAGGGMLSDAAVADLEEQTSGLLRLSESNLRLTHATSRIAGGRVIRELQYRADGGQRLTVLASAPESSGPGNAAPRVASLDGEPLVYWTQGRTAIGVTGDFDVGTLSRLADEVRERLDRPAS